MKELKYCDLKVILKKRGIFMVYYVRNKVNMGVIGNAAGANAGFYDQIRIYCNVESCSACTHSLSLPLKHNKLHTKPLYGVFHVT